MIMYEYKSYTNNKNIHWQEIYIGLFEVMFDKEITKNVLISEYKTYHNSVQQDCSYVVEKCFVLKKISSLKNNSENQKVIQRNHKII